MLFQANPSAVRCSAHASGKLEATNVFVLSDGGCRPSMMAVTISGASRLNENSLPSRVRQRLVYAAMLAIVLAPDTSTS